MVKVPTEKNMLNCVLSQKNCILKCHWKPVQSNSPVVFMSIKTLVDGKLICPEVLFIISSSK